MILSGGVRLGAVRGAVDGRLSGLDPGFPGRGLGGYGVQVLVTGEADARPLSRKPGRPLPPHPGGVRHGALHAGLMLLGSRPGRRKATRTAQGLMLLGFAPGRRKAEIIKNPSVFNIWRQNPRVAPALLLLGSAPRWPKHPPDLRICAPYLPLCSSGLDPGGVRGCAPEGVLRLPGAGGGAAVLPTSPGVAGFPARGSCSGLSTVSWSLAGHLLVPGALFRLASASSCRSHRSPCW